MKGVSLLLLCAAILRLCEAQVGVCYVTASQVSVTSYYVQTSYTYTYDCSNFGWGWSYCAATGYSTALAYSSSTGYVSQFTCCTGYQQVGTTQTCNDTNECASNGGLGPCQQICTNTVGSHYCSCLPGYTLSANGNSCDDINECTSSGGQGPCQQICTNTVGSYYCSCLLGYTLSANGTSCNVGSYYCSCLSGYALSANGASCNVLSNTATNVVSSNVAMTSVVAALPSVMPTPLKDVSIQVRLLNLADCTPWTVPSQRKALSQSIESNVNGHCTCNFTIANADVICFATNRVTLRGTVGAMQLAYLENWVMKIATTVTLQGVSLTVDNGCTVQIQYPDDPECPVPTIKASPTISKQQASQTLDAQMASTNSVGLPVGLAVGGVVAAALIAVIVVATILLIKAKRSTDRRTINPLYHSREASRASQEEPYANVIDCSEIVPAESQNAHYYNIKS
eukprot:Em0006g1310a